MDGKEIRSMAEILVSVLFGIMLLSVAAFLIGAGYEFWGTVSVQNTANSAMADYAKYVAYNNTTIRGQEVINVISETKGEPFVAVCDSGGDVICVSYNKYSDAAVKALASGGLPEYSHSAMSTIAAAISTLKAETSNGLIAWGNNCNTGDLVLNWGSGATTYVEDLQNWLLETRGGGEYKTYNAALLYDSDSSSDVIGIILVEE